jgi:geranylgeranyl transferase type-2 subunit beta
MDSLTIDRSYKTIANLFPVLLSLIRPDGQVAGDSFGETDSRFTYILLNALSLLDRLSDLDSDTLHGGKARELIVANLRGCMNFDSGFGTTPGAESHGGQSESLTRVLQSLYVSRMVGNAMQVKRYRSWPEVISICHQRGRKDMPRYEHLLTSSLGMPSSLIHPKPPRHSRPTHTRIMALRTSTPQRRS